MSSVNLLLERDEGDDEAAKLEGNKVLKVATWICNSTDYYDGEKFFTLVGAALPDVCSLCGRFWSLISRKRCRCSSTGIILTAWEPFAVESRHSFLPDVQ